jgi:hypothetical protein
VFSVSRPDTNRHYIAILEAGDPCEIASEKRSDLSHHRAEQIHLPVRFRR